MAAWDRRYNISGNVHLGEQLDAWCDLLRDVLDTENVGPLFHMTGATSVYALSSTAFVKSSGFDNHDFWAYAYGERAEWLTFAKSLEEALTSIAMPYSVTVHDSVLTLS